MIKTLLKSLVLIALLWITAAPLLAAEPFSAKLKFDEHDRATLRWPIVEGAAEYCIRDASNPESTWERCLVGGPGRDYQEYPLYLIYLDPITKDSKFTVTANDKDGKPIPNASTTSTFGINGVVTAQTEFGNFAELGDYAAKIMQYALPAGIALSILMTVYAGIQYMLSQGQPDKIKDAQEILQGAILGLIVLIMARFMVNFLLVPTTKTPTAATEKADIGAPL